MIAISAGHYPERPGACYEDFCEHGEAKSWAIIITDHLIRLGCDARLVPSGVLSKKVEYTNGCNADIAIEIHFNSAVSKGEHVGEGCETLFYPESQKGAFIAGEIQTALAPGLFRDRGIKPGWYRMNPKKGVDFFLARTKCPAIIIEPDFIHRVNHIQSNREQACELISETLMRIQHEP